MHYEYRTCPCGAIRGIGTEEYALFKGVPYAQAERWEAPVPVTQWEGEFDGTRQGVACPQSNTYGLFQSATSRFYKNEVVEKPLVEYSEDCLNLNIWAPHNAESLPVLVYIHGGSYETGNASAPAFSGVSYCRRNIILVNISYRLNVLASGIGDGHKGNYGLQDQICALQWIQRNIAAFGGDPDKVTIMGESAGAISVQTLLLAPQAKGLFRGAIMLSGGGIFSNTLRIKAPEEMEPVWRKLKTCFGAKTLDDLKNIPHKELFAVWKSVAATSPRFAFPALPVIDGEFIPEDPRKLAEAGKVNGVPTIISVLSKDMWPHALYEATVDWALLMEQAGLPPVYGMFFDRAVPDSDHGAYHGCDLRYVFDTLHISWRNFTETDHRISRNIIDYFANFIKTGTPTAPELPQWLPLGNKQRDFMHFGDAPCAMEAVPAEQLLVTEQTGKQFPT